MKYLRKSFLYKCNCSEAEIRFIDKLYSCNRERLKIINDFSKRCHSNEVFIIHLKPYVYFSIERGSISVHICLSSLQKLNRGKKVDIERKDETNRDLYARI